MTAAEPLPEHVRELVALAWGRALGVPDDVAALARATGRRVALPRPAGPETEVLLLEAAGLEVLAGPEPLLAAAADRATEELALESTLLRLASGWGPRSRGEHTLLHLDEPPEVAPSGRVAVSDDPADAAALARECPADDARAAGLDELHALRTLVPDDGAGRATGTPLAAAGHVTRSGLLADVRVLVRPELRGRGLGAYAAAVAAGAAWDEGLVPQARVPAAQDGALRLALGVGFVPTGRLTRVELTRAG